jgi:8-oxo-dGTP diphosphatase
VSDATVVPCAGAIVRDDEGRLLLVQRGHEPGIGLWTLPGGRCEPGEVAAVACVREVSEECGLVVAVVREAGTVLRPGVDDGVTYLITDFICEALDGVLTAGDDAADARWVSEDEIGSYRLTVGLWEALAEWGVIGPQVPH